MIVARRGCAVLIIITVFVIPLFAGAAEYQSLRFEEDWRANCSDITPKCWRIGNTNSLTFGADTRVRMQGYRPLDFGVGSSTSDDSYLLFRGMAHGDLRIGTYYAQVFVQFGVYNEVGCRGGPIRVDRSSPDVQQGFFAWNGDVLSFLVGRQ